MDEQRIDKWLWCTRLYKTRAIASDAIKTGRVTLNGQRAKPARNVRVGDAVVVRKPPYEYVLTVRGLSQQRVAAAGVEELYVEAEQSREKRVELSESIKTMSVTSDLRGRKPTKKERRDRDRLKRSI